MKVLNAFLLMVIIFISLPAIEKKALGVAIFIIRKG